MKKTDLRYIKTDELIVTQYLDFIKTQGKEPSVTGFCRLARINPSTFYTHYLDMIDLHEQICQRTIQELLKDKKGISSLLTNPALLVHTLFQLTRENHEQLHRLFHRHRWYMTDLVEEEILKHYITDTSLAKLEQQIRFCIGGALRILALDHSETKVEEVIELIEKVLGTNS